MSHKAKILKDSIYLNKFRLTTMEVTFPRIVLAEFNTHKMLSKNSASSRAIPVKKMLEKVQNNPYIPFHWGKNQRGMQAEEEISAELREIAAYEWLKARDAAVEHAEKLMNIGIHKQITNRLLEPFMWHTVIVTGTEYSNFFNLRTHKDAHPDIRKIAELMLDEYKNSVPQKLEVNDWHRPLVDDKEFDGNIDYWNKVCVGRCARVSYLTHDGIRDPSKDIELFDRLLTSGHLSPMEHLARPMSVLELEQYGKRDEYGNMDLSCAFNGNTNGWFQYRKYIKNESDILREKNHI